MNILHKVTWKSMWKNRTRTIVTILGVILSAAMFCAVTTMGASILSYLIQLQIATGGDYHVSATVLSREEADTVRTHEDVVSAAQAGILGVVNLYGQEMGPNSAMVKACNTQYFDSMPGFDHIEGRFPQNSSELMIGEYLLHTMEDKGYATTLGSQVTLPVTPVVEAMGQGDPDALDFTVTGIIVGILPFEYDITLPHEKGTYSHIYMGLDENISAPLYFDLFLNASTPYRALALAESVNGAANYSLLQYYGIAEAGNVTILIAALMTAVIAIVLIGTISLISNAFSISVTQRIQEFGLLSSVGATKKQLRSSVQFEAGLLCLYGIPLGLLVGFLSAKMLLDSSADTVESMLAVAKTGVKLKTIANAIALFGAAGIAATAIFLSAWIPSIKAAKVTPITAIRREAEYQPDRKSPKVSRKWWNPSRICTNMADKYYRINRKKYRPIVVALGISVVIFLSATAVSSSLQFMSDSFDTENSDFHVFIHNGDETLLNQIRNHESVSESVLYESDQFYAIIPEESESPQRQQVFDEDGWEDLPQEDAWKSNATTVYYLEDDAFRAFLQERGVDPEPYFAKETSIAAVFYQKWGYVGMNEEGYNDWLPITFPPLRDSVSNLSVVPDAPDVDEYVTTQIKAQGYLETLSSEREFDTLPDGRIIFRDYVQGCSIKQHSGGMNEIVAEGPIQTFTFLAVEETAWENQRVIRYYAYDEGTGTVGNTSIAEVPGYMDTVRIGAQLDGIPFGLPNDAGDALRLTLFRPLSMLEHANGLPTLSIRTNNYPATKSYLDSLAEDGNVLVYNDYLAEQYQARQASNLIELFAFAFVMVMTLISVANVFNVVSTNILLRRRDIGMLRSLGMTGRGIFVMTAWEYLSCGMRSLCWSLPVGLLLTKAITVFLADVINGGIQIPWWAVAVAIFSVFIVVGSSLIYALHHIRKDNPVDAIRMENT